MKSVLTWCIAVILVIGAWAVTRLAPSDDAGREVFVTQVPLGERGVGRNLAATVDGVEAAHTVASESGWQADGTWLIVEVTAEAMTSQSTGALGVATLQIGDLTFSASERGDDEMSIYQAALVPGVPKTGSLLFELPDDALHGTGVLRLATGLTESWGDSILEFSIDLDAVPTEAAAFVPDTEWTTP